VRGCNISYSWHGKQRETLAIDNGEKPIGGGSFHTSPTTTTTTTTINLVLSVELEMFFARNCAFRVSI
jgi:hypothetical protein